MRFLLLFLFIAQFSYAQKISKKEIRISLDHSTTPMFEDVISEIDFIPLTSIKDVGRFNSMVIIDSTIILADRKMIYLFGNTGRIDRSIDIQDKFGSTIRYIRKHETLGIHLHLTSDEVMHITLEGELIKKTALSPLILDSLRLGSQDILLYKPLNRNPDLFRMTADDSILYRYPFSEINTTNLPPIMAGSIGFKGPGFQNKYLSHYIFSPDILEFDDSHNVIQYRFVYPLKNTLNISKLNFSDIKIFQQLSEEEYIYSYNHLIRHEKGILFSVKFTKKYPGVYTYNLESGELLNLSSLSSTRTAKNIPVISRLMGPIAYQPKENVFYSLIYPDDMFFTLDKLDLKDSMTKKIVQNKNATIVKFKLK